MEDNLTRTMSLEIPTRNCMRLKGSHSSENAREKQAPIPIFLGRSALMVRPYGSNIMVHYKVKDDSDLTFLNAIHFPQTFSNAIQFPLA